MTWVDVICAVILAWFAYSGFMMGLIRSIFRFLAIVVAMVVTWLFTTPMSNLFSAFIPDASGWALQPTLAVLLFIIFFLATTVLGRILSEQLEENGFGALDQMGGLGLGLLKAWLISLVFVSIVAAIPTESAEQTRQSSYSYQFYTKHSIKMFKGLWGVPVPAEQDESSKYE